MNLFGKLLLVTEEVALGKSLQKAARDAFFSWRDALDLAFLGVAGLAMKGPATSVAARGESNVVYRSLNAAGEVQYVGITNNLARRAAEHLASKGIQIEKLMGGLSRAEARTVEQALIEIHGLGKSGGTLLNRINSIASSNPAYAAQVQRGYELLQSIGY